MGLLKEINKPQDIKKYSMEQLNEIAKEIRQLILETVSVTGGHLAPSLGVVELTLALHYVYNSPQDKIVWDVGHQSYVHKILTGRREEFSTLRQYGGISGFPKREESAHDVFATGHSSTSISAALGFAQARDKLGLDYEVVAVIGDGAMTGGMAFEALNHAGHLGADLLVILNDNEMSIDQNVGAMSSYLSRLRADPMYTKRKEDIEYILKKVPAIGSTVVKAVERVKDSLKYLLVPGILFEELGFTYLGPIDGHNIPEISMVLRKAKKLKGPVLLHVITQKGRGYEPAVCNPAVFHGVAPFQLKTGCIIKNPGPSSYTSVFSEALTELAEKDQRIIAITAAMPEGTGLNSFAKKYPQRFYDVGIAEQHAVTMASAMALEGLRPVVAIYSTFLQRAYDQILHDVCLQKAPVLFAIDRGGLVGEDGPTHHGVFDYSYLRHIPGMAVLAPKDEEELRHMIYTALQYDGPVAVRYPRGAGIGVDISEDFRLLPWGKGEVLAKGDNLAILAVGSMVYPALTVKKILEYKGIRCTVVNGRFIKPLDQELIVELAQTHPCLVTMEENVIAGGFGSGVLELLTNSGINGVKVLNIGVPDQFVTHGKVDILKEAIGLTPEKIAEQIVSHFALPEQKVKPQKVPLTFAYKQG
ncbi:MAG: 1-deoxy-D-xylulose-5-phosphate synthase [Bacillota bacterium]|uniref:1-deoxy-D-xylulose-5-phosphate synthase n=1 Tax=Thermanaerosceptrum fracticalcis TaxID=1712410 RepID=A0A7G6E0D9_THEFR|nr:1-deoxy-D-xylulose-5-phosphate synthase [Thermanaerosceptrum fracticalcis]QNB45543.1 1-deoxy-D-xylulose-5-phosphate synthase [Thermanaerosceptrum fracticalcis]